VESEDSEEYLAGFWFRDDVARFRTMYFQNPAEFVAGIVQRHHPRALTGLSFVFGSDRPGLPPSGWTGCPSVLVPETQIKDLCTLANELRGHARMKKLLFPRSRRQHERGPYCLHVLRRRLGRRTFLHDDRRMIAIVDLPVHEQYGFILQN